MTAQRPSPAAPSTQPFRLAEALATARGVMRVLAFVGLLVVLVPLHIVWRVVGRNRPFLVVRLFHRAFTRLIGIDVRTRGEPSPSRPTLFVANHLSYLDVPVLATVLETAFVAKSEIASWPLFGLLARLQNSVFIERRTVKARVGYEAVRRALGRGQNLVLFAEGTSTDGRSVLPLKSSLLAAVSDSTTDEHPLTVQPITLTCTHVAGLPVGRAWRHRYAWYGDMTFLPHLWKVFRGEGLGVEVVFHPPFTASACPHRKDIAARCHRAIVGGLLVQRSPRGK